MAGSEPACGTVFFRYMYSSMYRISGYSEALLEYLHVELYMRNNVFNVFKMRLWKSADTRIQNGQRLGQALEYITY